MSAVESIEVAVANLPPADLAEFRRWFAEFDGAAWDARIKSDARAGGLDGYADEALAEYRAGNTQNVGCGEVRTAPFAAA
ncbi:MAG: hypothetical protein Q7W53_03380 [Pseudomonadota bacterium]|nr:hypothetical protein [Pseudomonadota bacterium]MDP2354252.1 hypothetical protein [Pseudomonadota bacterium]